MQTMDSLPQIPQAHMQGIMKDFKKIDQELASHQPGNIIEELVPQEQEPVQQEAAPQQEAQQEHGSRNEHPNFVALREERERADRERERSDRARERAERERDELMMKFREMELQRLHQQTQVSAEQEPVHFNLAPDSLTEGKHFNDLDHRVSKRIRNLEDQVKQYQKQTSQRIMETQLKAQHPDFDSVVSKSNVEELRRAHPSIAQALAVAASNDEYSAASSLYTIIKELGIAKSMQESNMTRKILQDNAAKPRSAQAASPQRGSTPLSKANEFMVDGKMTPEYQNQLLKEMNDARRQGRR